jgi:beta-lactamase class D
MENIMLIEEKPNYKLYGKTGWAQADENINIGWFVGYALSKHNVFYFATNVQPKDSFNMSNFGSIRVKVTLEALESILGQ